MTDSVRRLGRWPVWRQPRRVLVVLGVVEASAIAAPICMWTPFTRSDLDLALLLVSLSATYSLVVAAWEKARQYLLFERTPTMTPNVLATWCFSAAIMLPLNLAAGVIIVAMAGDWPSYNVAGPKRLYRFVYSVACCVLAATAVTALARLPVLARLPLAAAAWLGVSIAVISLAMAASGRTDGVRVMLQPRTHSLELVTVGLAVAEYALYAAGLPSLIWLSLPVAVAVQRWFTHTELRRWDRPSRLMAEEAWLHVAQVVVAASVTTSIVRIDSPDPAAARAAAMMQAGCDAIGSYGAGRGLAILLPDCPPQNGDALARRLRAAMRARRVPCHIAAAAKPQDGQSLGDLLAICEAEIVAREAAGQPAPTEPA